MLSHLFCVCMYTQNYIYTQTVLKLRVEEGNTEKQAK